MSMYKQKTVAVGTVTPVKILDYDAEYKSIDQSINEIIVIVNGANDVVIGYDENVTVATGYPIDATVEPRSKTFKNLRQNIYAIATVASSVNVDVSYNAVGPIQV